MAIKKTITMKGNIEILDAYIKIAKIHEEDNICEYSIYVSKNKEESDKKNYVEIKYGYSCNIQYNTDKDFRKQCYEDLKLREDFIGAIDVLEVGQLT